MPRTAARHSQRLPRGQAGIQNFARATKPGVALGNGPGKKDGGTGLTASPSKKRKLCEVVEGEGDEERESAEDDAEETPRRKAGGVGLTPSKSLRIGELTVSTPVRRKTVSGARSIGSSPCSQPANEEPKPTYPPPAFTDLLNLHSSFLKALTIHSAHNGPATPADLREFLRSVERLWRMRKVVVQDMQRLVWVWDQGANSTGHSYRLANYGLGKVCLERTVRDGARSESELQAQFEQNLDSLWEKSAHRNEGEENGSNFVATLGLSPIHESLTPFTSFRKGQQRLQDLKGGVIRTKTEKLRNEPDEESEPNAVENASTRRKGLWDRIKDKQLRQSKLPPPPSKEMLLRRAAAERVEEVAGVLALLRPTGCVNARGAKAMIAGQRKPFRLEMIVQHVQDSMRNPISVQEVEICLDLLAQANIAGQWVNMVTVNQLRSVVLKSCADVSPKAIGARVCEMRAGWDEPGSRLELVS